MTFISVRFAVFVVLFLIIYQRLKANHNYQNYLLLVGNYVFYSLIDIRFSAILLFVSVITWLLVKRNRTQCRTLLILGVSVNVGMLLFFKYIGLFGTLADEYGIIMPIGLSFYTFEAISYIVDSYKGKIENEASLLEVMIYLSFFPLVMSGPIVKARDFLPQLKRSRNLTLFSFENGIQRFMFGVFEKVVMADRLAVSVDSVYSAPGAYSGASLLWNSLSYSLQLLFDFAGYSNMAIGLAMILGFSVGENFDLPYIAKSPSDFWKRWHISLSSWLTEYIYIPLGGSRKGKKRTYINILITMLISGMWHGSTLNYVLWGGAHGLSQIFFKQFERIRKRAFTTLFDPISNLLGIVFTFSLVNFLWIPFRTDDFSMTMLVIKRIFTNASGMSYFYSYTLFFLVGLIVVEAYAVIKNDGKTPLKPLNLRTFQGKFVFITLIFLILMFAYFGNSAFIYGAKF